MHVIKSEIQKLESSEGIVRTRQTVRVWMVELKFNIVDQTKLVTALSELARNSVDYGGGGTVLIESLQDEGRAGIRLVVEDHGPGIADIDQAMKDGYTTGGGLGLGLGGAKRLVNEFEIWSQPGAGTRITITRWK